MAGSERATLRPFTPSRERPEALEERTVGRDDILQTIDRRLVKAATSKNRSHTLIVGPRGSGKTHLVEVTLHRLRDDPRFTANAVVGRVDEDVVGIISYADVLLELLASLDPPEDVLQQARAGRDVAAIEAAISAHLDGRLLVAVIENLSRVFDNMGTTGQRDLRSFIENSGQVILLASTPLLFQGIGSREEPWFGSFAIEHLSELTLDEGTELIRRLAFRDGDDRFVRFLDDPRGKARLAALHHLAGGSPRLWMILAGCATVELLDDLVPAVEELLEKLATYYQQRLWDLPGNEAKLVRELGTGPTSSSVAELAAACGLDVRTAATALGRLTESGWVRSEKVPGTDQRKTWYRLREPLLRHHFQYRRAGGEPLRLIVEILRLWFDPSERRSHLAGVRPASEAERHLLATLRLDPPQRSNAAYADRDVDELLADARRWIVGDSDAIGTVDAGVLLDAVVGALRSSTATARRVLDARAASPSVRARADRLFELIDSQTPELPLEDRIGNVLNAAAAASVGKPDHRLLELVAACWNGHSEPALTVQRLKALMGPADTDRLGLTIREEHTFWLAEAGRHGEAVEAYTIVLNDRTRVLGNDHPDTLMTRHNLAFELGQVGRHDEAVAAFTALVNDRARVLGDDHPDTFTTRRHLIAQMLQADRLDDAVVAYAALAEDCALALGGDEADLLRRHGLALSLGRAGRHDEAIAADNALINDCTRILGPDHLHTLTARFGLATRLGLAGRHDEAVTAYTALLDDRAPVVGADHPDTLRTRRSLAYQLGKAGAHEEAIAVAAGAFDDAVARHGVAHESAEEASKILAFLIVDLLRSGLPLPARERLGSFVSSELFAMLKDMEAARDGSAEASVRLPAELRSLVERPAVQR